MDPIKEKQDTITLYLKVMDQINAFIGLQFDEDGQEYDSTLKEQYESYYAKEIELYMAKKSELKAQYAYEFITKVDRDIAIGDRCEQITRSVGVPLN